MISDLIVREYKEGTEVADDCDGSHGSERRPRWISCKRERKDNEREEDDLSLTLLGRGGETGEKEMRRRLSFQ
ncbi:hypothetical protein MRB53_020495 [Persea americana]|uniref:Uncharacterized protein n=1 Tax=Persea americana TaxID=3435 RepID=A0ACC2L1P9_PERAE|nr:hypothetical protein MRB53_020495 [Persea americana]